MEAAATVSHASFVQQNLRFPHPDNQVQSRRTSFTIITHRSCNWAVINTQFKQKYAEIPLESDFRWAMCSGNSPCEKSKFNRKTSILWRHRTRSAASACLDVTHPMHKRGNPYLPNNFEFCLDCLLTKIVRFSFVRRTNWSLASFWDQDDENLFGGCRDINVLVWMVYTDIFSRGRAIINQGMPAVRLLIGLKCTVQFAINSDTYWRHRFVLYGSPKYTFLLISTHLWSKVLWLLRMVEKF